MIAISTRSRGYAPGRTDAEDAADVECVVQALQEQPDHRIELPRTEASWSTSRAWIRAIVSSPVRRGERREGVVGLQRVEDRLVARVDLGVAGDPCAQRGPAFAIGGERVERFGRGAHLARHLPGELAEHVFLAREVLVEGDARAPRELRDPVDAAAVVPLLPEGAQRRVEDALLGPPPADADLGVVGERRAANDRDGAVGGPSRTLSGIVGPSGAPRRRNDNGVSKCSALPSRPGRPRIAWCYGLDDTDVS